MDHAGPVYDATLSMKHELVITTSTLPGDRMYMWGLDDRARKKVLSCSSVDPDACQPLQCVAADENMLAVAQEGYIYLWNLEWDVCERIIHTGQVFSSPNGHIIV